jgi:hypothetical protein
VKKILTALLYLPFYLFSFDFEPVLFDEVNSPDQMAVIKSNFFKKEQWRPYGVFFNEDESCAEYHLIENPNLLLQLRFIDDFVFYDNDLDVYQDLLTHTVNYVFQNPNKEDLSYEILSNSYKDVYVKWSLKNPHKGFPKQCGFSRIHLTPAGVHVLSYISLDPSIEVENLQDPYEAFYEDVLFLDTQDVGQDVFSFLSLGNDPVVIPNAFQDFNFENGRIFVDNQYSLFFRKFYRSLDAESYLGVFCFDDSKDNPYELADSIDQIKTDIFKAYKLKVSVDVEKKDNLAIIKYKGNESSGFCIHYFFAKNDKIYAARFYHTASEYDPSDVDYFLAKIQQIKFFK